MNLPWLQAFIKTNESQSFVCNLMHFVCTAWVFHGSSDCSWARRPFSAPITAVPSRQAMSSPNWLSINHVLHKKGADPNGLRGILQEFPWNV
jgi:hypothetical protein